MGAKGIVTDRAYAVTVIALGRAIEIAVNESGLTSSQFRALSLVDAGITSGGVLARFLAVRPPTVTTVMNGLVDDGLVSRTRAEDDRRRVDYEVTATGRVALDAANEVADAVLTSLTEAFGADDRKAACAGLDIWRAALDAKRTGR